jgi:hypothetical protein
MRLVPDYLFNVRNRAYVLGWASSSIHPLLLSMTESAARSRLIRAVSHVRQMPETWRDCAMSPPSDLNAPVMIQEVIERTLQ